MAPQSPSPHRRHSATTAGAAMRALSDYDAASDAIDFRSDRKWRRIEGKDDGEAGKKEEEEDHVVMKWRVSGGGALWSETNKNRDVSTGPLVRPFARTAHSFACSGLLASLAPSAALTRSLAHFAHSLARGTVNDWMPILSVFFLYSGP